MTDVGGYHEQLQRDSKFLCSDQRMDAKLLDKLVLQLNRIHPQILSDKEAHRFRNLSVPAEVRLSALLNHLQWKGEEACHEFYIALHIHAEHVYPRLPSRVRLKEMTETTSSDSFEQNDLKDRGPMFYLSCFSFVLGIAMLYYSSEGETLRCTEPFLHCSAARLSKERRRPASVCSLDYAMTAGMWPEPRRSQLNFVEDPLNFLFFLPWPWQR